MEINVIVKLVVYFKWDKKHVQSKPNYTDTLDILTSGGSSQKMTGYNSTSLITTPMGPVVSASTVYINLLQTDQENIKNHLS